MLGCSKSESKSKMKQNKKTILFFTMTAVFFAAVFVHIYFSSQTQVTSVPEVEIISPMPQESTVTGLIVPHFAPVSYMTEDALKQVTTIPDLIILIGPNHHEAGAFPITTGIYQSQIFHHDTNFATEKIQQLASLGIVQRDDAVISGDHSIGTPLPIILSRFPNAKVLAIVLKYRPNPQNIEKLILGLESISTTNTLIIASLDFSHYLSSDIAPQKDSETEKYIAAHDYKHIESLSNDYLDSPWTLITFLKYLEAHGVYEGKQLIHTNTGQVAGQTIESSTSFFTYIFQK